jgi:ribosome recycling factor
LEQPRAETYSIFLLAKSQIILLTFLLISYFKEFFMDYSALKSEVEQKTAQTLEVLQGEFAGLRTGRASVHLLDGVKVPVYGSEMPLNQVATVSTPDTQTLSVTVWDVSNAPAVEKAIRDSGLGLNPMTAGGVIRLNLPPLTEERRRELTKVAGKYAEEAKISMRNIRQDAMSKIKRAVTDKEISEDDQRKYEEDIQKVFDARAAEVDAMAKQKETDIMSV